MKINKPIEVTYQATAVATGLDDVKMDVYDESHAIDVAKGVAAMTEIGETGRYYGIFTPDAEGEWTVIIDSITKPGKIVKKYTVVAHDVDSVGDAVDGLNDLASGDVDTALATYDAPTKAELDAVAAVTDAKVDALNDIDAAAVAGELATYDSPTKAELDAGLAGLNDVSSGDLDTAIDSALATYDGPTKAEMDTKIDGISLESGPMVG